MFRNNHLTPTSSVCKRKQTTKQTWNRLLLSRCRLSNMTLTHESLTHRQDMLRLKSKCHSTIYKAMSGSPNTWSARRSRAWYSRSGEERHPGPTRGCQGSEVWGCRPSSPCPIVSHVNHIRHYSPPQMAETTLAHLQTNCLVTQIARVSSPNARHQIPYQDRQAARCFVTITRHSAPCSDPPSSDLLPSVRPSVRLLDKWRKSIFSHVRPKVCSTGPFQKKLLPTHESSFRLWHWALVPSLSPCNLGTLFLLFLDSICQNLSYAFTPFFIIHISLEAKIRNDTNDVTLCACWSELLKSHN